MPNLGVAELMVIFIVALLVFGPQKLPEIGRQVGAALTEFRRMQSRLRAEVRDVLDPMIPASPSAPVPTLPPVSDAPATESEASSDASDREPDGRPAEAREERSPEGSTPEG